MVSDPSTEKKYAINSEIEFTDREIRILKKCTRKIDLRVLPIVIILYICSLIDRSNIGAAIVNGLVTELKLSPVEEKNVTAIFYVFYILCETPSNILLKKFKPHVWFAIIGSGWSLTCIGLAFAHTGALFIVLRSILGALEAGLMPGVVGYLSYWYSRKELGFRMTLFFMAVPISGIIGSPIAGALASLKIGMLKSYQCIFFFEGIATLIICIASYFLVQDYPDKVGFFTEEERSLVLCRLNSELGMASKSRISLKQTIKAFMDWKIWVFALMFFGVTNGFIVVSIFSPTLVKSLGYSSIKATYLAIIPSIGGFIGMVIVLNLIGKVKYWILLVVFSLTIVLGYTVTAFGKGKILRLVFLGVAGLGANGITPIALSWMNINQGGIYKGMVASAFVVSVGSIAGVVSPTFYVAKYGPKYTYGSIFTICVSLMMTVLTIILVLYFKYENDRRDKNPVDVSYLTEDEQRELNDLHPQFRYIY
ncbi:hypothetical protein BB559_005696 [Furculomyces boomerangus]|uniref:Major facilitator superfamily (MFS) profile domain-containing protein n=1 Tax=Furculomyces boomerangus TaxID=61424 RepID=A0A2T9Y781_9FUNG|nr:hypothetical protein BB559_005696 [Furculomyces boomerangus]